MLGGDGHQFPRPLQPAIAFIGGRRKRRNLLWRRRIFALCVIGGFHLDPAQSNDFGPTDNPDLLLGRTRTVRGKQSVAQALLPVLLDRIR